MPYTAVRLFRAIAAADAIHSQTSPALIPPERLLGAGAEDAIDAAACFIPQGR